MKSPDRGHDLFGKRVLVTGMAGALGRVVALRAAALGGEVIGVDQISPPDMPCLTARLDELASTRAALADIGRIDCLFHIAGAFDMGPPAHDVLSPVWDDMQRANVTTLRHVLSEIVPGMLAAGRGSIVTIGALSALTGKAAMSGYCAAKSSVMRISESLSQEVRHKGVNVNCVLPSIIDTPANRRAMPDAAHERWVSPADLANAICFLGSDNARAIHGALLPVSGLCA